MKELFETLKKLHQAGYKKLTLADVAYLMQVHNLQKETGFCRMSDTQFADKFCESVSTIRNRNKKLQVIYLLEKGNYSSKKVTSTFEKVVNVDTLESQKVLKSDTFDNAKVVKSDTLTSSKVVNIDTSKKPKVSNIDTKSIKSCYEKYQILIPNYNKYNNFNNIYIYSIELLNFDSEEYLKAFCKFVYESYEKLSKQMSNDQAQRIADSLNSMTESQGIEALKRSASKKWANVYKPDQPKKKKQQVDLKAGDDFSLNVVQF